MSGKRDVRPFVAASQQANALLTERLARLVDAIRSQTEERLRAVVLTGSLARGEGVVLASPDGPRLLSDIDLYMVLEPVHPEHDREIGARIRRQFESDAFLTAPMDVGVVSSDFFAHQGNVLPAHQIQHAHRVLWEGGVGWTTPGSVAAPGTVDPDDARKLLHNRMAEQLLLDGGDLVDAERRPGSGRADSPQAAFHRWKLWLDAPLAFLAAYGQYAPEREAQRERLAALGRDWSGAERDWLDAGVERARSMREAMATREIDPRELRDFAEPALDRAWVWPFHRALLDRGLGARDGDAARRLQAATRRGEPGAPDVEQGRRWLRRRGWLAGAREARRWAPLAGFPITPWWRHGPTGTGPDRIHLAAAWRFGGLSAWREPLQSLLRERMPAVDGPAQDVWLGRLWSSWIMGGART